MRWSGIVSHSWLAAPLLGAAIGTPVLGVGGRLAMRAIALASGAPGAFTLEGTMTVVLLGAVSGAAGGLMYAVAQRVLPRVGWARLTLFFTMLVLVTLRGLRPVDPLRLALFMPLVLVYGTLMELAWQRRRTGAPRAEAVA